MFSRKYSIVEPHPSITPQQYIATGRGGAGNAVKAPSTVTRGSDASGPAARVADLSSTTSRRSYITGRGGAGNVHQEAPRIFSFDEELEQQMKHTKHVAPVYHVGRGGVGNLRSTIVDSHPLVRRPSHTSASSTSSAESGADIATRNLKKGLKKLANVF